MRPALAITALLFLLCGSQAAWSMGSYTARTTTYSSLPCPSPVVEHWYEGGNVHSSEMAVNLVCPTEAGTAKWIIMSGVSCDDGGVDDAMEKACNSPLAKPIEKFKTIGQEHTYDLGKYVLARDCREVPFKTSFNGSYLGDKAAITSDQKGWLCQSITKIDGLKHWDEQGHVQGPGQFRYVHVVTRGDDGKEDEDNAWHLTILGVADQDADYRVTFKNGEAAVFGLE